MTDNPFPEPSQAKKLAETILLIVGHDLTTVLLSERAAAVAAAQAGIDDAYERAAREAEEIGGILIFDPSTVECIATAIRAMKGGK